MRIFVLYLDFRHVLDVSVGETVGEVKSLLRRKFDLNVQNGSEENDLLMQLLYAGSSLQDEWVLTDIGIPPGATLRCLLQERIKTYLYVVSVYNNELISFTEPFKVWETKVELLRSMIQNKTGLPVSVFRVTTMDGKEMYDCHYLKHYNIDDGDTIRMETWDGWNDFLLSVTKGQITPTMRHITSTYDDPALARYQLRVALFVAAHFGYNQLASQLLKSGARCDEPVGPHPSREWCKQNIHPDCSKSPAHECAQMGNLGCLRVFLHHNPAVILAKDSSGLTPCNVSRRYHQTECFKLLIAEQFRSRSMEGLNLGIYLKVRKWCERARDRAVAYHSKDNANPILLDMVKRHNVTAVVGQKVQVDGFGENMQSGAPGKKTRNKHSKGSKLIPSVSSGMHSRQITPVPSTLDESTKKMSTLKKRGSESSSSSGSGGANKTLECATCSEINDTRCSTGSRLPSRGKELPGIRNLEKEREARRLNRTVYRWIADSDQDSGSPSDEHNSLVLLDEDNRREHSNLNTLENSKQVAQHDDKEGMFLTELDYQLKGKATSPMQQRKLNVVSESAAEDDLISEGFNLHDKNCSKMPPIENKQLISKSTSRSNLHSERKIPEKISPRLSQKGPKTSSAVLSSASTPRSSLSSRRTRSMDDMVDTFELYKKITGQSLRESAVHSMEVANSFSEKEWLQQVRMAILLNRNTFKRRISQQSRTQRSFTLD